MDYIVNIEYYRYASGTYEMQAISKSEIRDFKNDMSCSHYDEKLYNTDKVKVFLLRHCLRKYITNKISLTCKNDVIRSDYMKKYYVIVDKVANSVFDVKITSYEPTNETITKTIFKNDININHFAMWLMHEDSVHFKEAIKNTKFRFIIHDDIPDIIKNFDVKCTVEEVK